MYNRPLCCVRLTESYDEILSYIKESFLRERLEYIVSQKQREFLKYDRYAKRFGESKEIMWRRLNHIASEKRREFLKYEELAKEFVEFGESPKTFFSQFAHLKKLLYAWKQAELSVRLVVLVFGRPTLKIVKEQIMPDIDYWHHVTGQNIDFFYIGFYKEDYEFDADKFEVIKHQLEQQCTWKYSHQTDVLLLNAYLKGEAVYLDFSQVVSLSLEQALEEKAITSVPQFFGQIVDFTKNFKGNDPAWGFSNSQGKQIVGSALKRLVISLLPEVFREDARKAFHFYVRDFTKSNEL